MTTADPNFDDDSLGLTQERFGFTLFMSVCVHVMLILGIGFTVVTKPRVSNSLDITLATYQSDKAPDKADFLAQANQQGSGSEDKALAPSTDVASRFTDKVIRDAADTLPRQATAPPVQADHVVARQSDAATRSTDLPPDPRAETTPDAKQPTAEQLQQQMASLQAQLDLQREAYANRPRRYTMTSASTKKAADAQYLDSWRKRIEAIGNLNYPQQASAQGIYGTLRLMVALNPDGTVNDIRILRSSGERVLDQAAVRIVKLAAPFDPFPAEMRSRVDILEIIRTWQFHRGNTFSSF